MSFASRLLSPTLSNSNSASSALVSVGVSAETTAGDVGISRIMALRCAVRRASKSLEFISFISIKWRAKRKTKDAETAAQMLMRVIRATVRHMLEPDVPPEFEWPDRPFHPEGFRQYLARSHGTQGFSRAGPDHRKCLILDGIRRKARPSGRSCRRVPTEHCEARRAAPG